MNSSSATMYIYQLQFCILYQWCYFPWHWHYPHVYLTHFWNNNLRNPPKYRQHLLEQKTAYFLDTVSLAKKNTNIPLDNIPVSISGQQPAAMESGVDDSSPSPPLPLYVLRGHSAQINTVHFLRSNSRLLTGDADGWVIMWKISSRRPVAVWRPHENAILGMKDWGENRVIT